jgi:hypothetical protein
MNEPIVGTYVIGQTPRPDLTEELTGRFPTVRFEILGALDGLDPADIPPCPPRGYPLETRLRDGSRVVVDAAFVEPLIKEAIRTTAPRASAHLLLCAGAFPRLRATAPIVRPFEVAATHLQAGRFRQLDVVVPFADQAPASMDKWGAAGFGCRAHAFDERPRHLSVAAWISGRLRQSRGQALVFDYVGLPSAILDEVAAEVDMPLFDLGRLALNALEETLIAARTARR